MARVTCRYRWMYLHPYPCYPYPWPAWVFQWKQAIDHPKWRGIEWVMIKTIKLIISHSIFDRFRQSRACLKAHRYENLYLCLPMTKTCAGMKPLPFTTCIMPPKKRNRPSHKCAHMVVESSSDDDNIDSAQTTGPASPLLQSFSIPDTFFNKADQLAKMILDWPPATQGFMWWEADRGYTTLSQERLVHCWEGTSCCWGGESASATSSATSSGSPEIRCSKIQDALPTQNDTTSSTEWTQPSMQHMEQMWPNTPLTEPSLLEWLGF